MKLQDEKKKKTTAKQQKSKLNWTKQKINDNKPQPGNKMMQWRQNPPGKYAREVM